jgi:hypothetical protein
MYILLYLGISLFIVGGSTIVRAMFGIEVSKVDSIVVVVSMVFASICLDIYIKDIIKRINNPT